MRRDPTDDAFLQPRVAAARRGMSTAAAAQAERAGREAGYERVFAEVRAWVAAKC